MVIAYIGDLDYPDFNWDNGKWDGNIPKVKQPEFPYGMKAFGWIIDKIQQGEFDGKQIDWGAFVARATKEQIIQFTSELYKPPYPDYMEDRIIEFIDYVSRLEGNKLYALIACECY